MPARRASRPIATLWQLSWNDDRLRCAIYRTGETGNQLEIRLQSGRKTLLAEPFNLGPKMISRTEALRRSLKRRGWREDAR